MTGYIDWVLSGDAVTAPIDLPALKQAIINQESAGDHTAVNSDSGAMGLGQVMPDNLAEVDKDGNPLPFTGWDYEALGKDISPEEFLASPDLQNQIMEHKLKEIALSQSVDANSALRTPVEIAKRTTAVWYSGDAIIVAALNKRPMLEPFIHQGRSIVLRLLDGLRRCSDSSQVN